MKKHLFLALCLAASTAVWAQNTPTTPAATAAKTSAAAISQARLVGKWEHTLQTSEWLLQQTTELKDNRKFTQHAVYKGPDGAVLADNTSSGDWSFDGTHFKRVFTHINNQKLKPNRQVRMEQKILSLSDSNFDFFDPETQKKLVFNRVQ